MKAKYLVSVLDILYKKYGIKFNINDTSNIVKQATKKIDDLNTFKDMPKTNGSHLATNIVQFLDERDRIKKQKGDK
jgi:organic radical activating enzyme